MKLEPHRVLGDFPGPEQRNVFTLTVSRTGRTVAARLGGPNGRIVARAEDPAGPEPTIRFEDLYNANSKAWKTEFKIRFAATLRVVLGQEAVSPE